MSKISNEHEAGLSFDWVYVRELRFGDNFNEIRPETLENLAATLAARLRTTRSGVVRCSG